MLGIGNKIPNDIFENDNIKTVWSVVVAYFISNLMYIISYLDG